jgi:pyruvate decarboxylase
LSKNETSTVGSYLATRLEQIGIRHYFAVPGDYNLILLDEFLKNENLKLIGCCNELNAGYAADGYARANGVSAVVVTFSVGGLSAINAIAGAYAEDLPVIIISGGPNSNSEAENQLLHHTCGEVRYGYALDIFSQVTAKSVIIRHLKDAPSQIDEAISACVRKRKPVYIEIACNIAKLETSFPKRQRFFIKHSSHPEALTDAVEHATSLLNKASKPVLVAGPRLRAWGAIESFQKFVDASGYAVAAMPNAKGFIPENHPSYIGTYWGPVSSPGTNEIVESADAYLFAGPIFTDYTTSGFTTLINQEKLINAEPDRIHITNQTYNDVTLDEFLTALADRIKPNNGSLKAYERIKTEYAPEPPIKPDKPLTTRRLFNQIQQVLDSNSVVIAETGDSWFNGMKLRLPEGARFEIQMQYGSIGWSVGATLGYELGSPKPCRVISLIGDGSFQLTAQEVSTMIRYGLKPIIFLINNGGYTIEVEIHDGPYNNIKNWKYAELINVFNADDGNGWSTKVSTEGELDKALMEALTHDGVSFIELIIDRDDCSKELLEWGSHVAANNGRPPRNL